MLVDPIARKRNQAMSPHRAPFDAGYERFSFSATNGAK